MRGFISIVVLILFASPAFSFFSFSSSSNIGGINGGSNCAACTVTVGLLEQLTEVYNKSIDKVLDEVCGFFPKSLSPICDYFVDEYGVQVIELIEAEQTADDVCNELKFCTDRTCRLFAPPPMPRHPSATQSTKTSKSSHKISVIETNPQMDKSRAEKNDLIRKLLSEKTSKLGNTPWQWIVDLLNRMSVHHEPVLDVDSDHYSDFSTLRGYSWKGRDCNDLDPAYRPGLLDTNSQSAIDFNCNGISGIDNSEKVSWEDELCGNSGAMGIAVVGDSFGAHFSIPPSYMNASEINSSTYVDLLSCIENEFDWPERSAFTGYNNVTGVMIDSIYLRMRERNLCNHRDYQNIGVNGASSNSLPNHYITSLARNQTTDKPLLLIFELIGNDVCGAHPHLSHMTNVSMFTKNILDTLSYLDTTLPKGSHIVFLGLADGRVLWDALHNRTHPLGVSYEDVYSFFNCLEVSPCWGWMNVNETIRNATSERAAELSAVYPQIIANYTYNNFDMAYYEFPFNEVNEAWVAEGGQTWELIEPIDGFHPNQVAHALIAENLWSKLQTDHPTFIGDVNPNNDLIAKLFGNQGGY